jgi:hypothetical protein
MNAAGVLFLMSAGLAAQTVNSDSAIVQDFKKRVDAYLQLRKDIESKQVQLKATASPDEIAQRQHELAHALREARKTAKQGDIFTPEISMEIRRLIGLATQPGDGPRVRRSLRSAEPVQLRLNVNESYPSKVPLQSTPPTLLQNLPKLPADIEYRLTGADLMLLDTKANLIIDIIRNVRNVSP